MSSRLRCNLWRAVVKSVRVVCKLNPIKIWFGCLVAASVCKTSQFNTNRSCGNCALATLWLKLGDQVKSVKLTKQTKHLTRGSFFLSRLTPRGLTLTVVI